MTTSDLPSGATSLLEQALDRIERAIARRADTLARGAPAGRGEDRRRWLRAELEIFERDEVSCASYLGGDARLLPRDGGDWD